MSGIPQAEGKLIDQEEVDRELMSMLDGVGDKKDMEGKALELDKLNYVAGMGVCSIGLCREKGLPVGVRNMP